MAKVFNPSNSLYVVASKPHPDNTEYRIAQGSEQWEAKDVSVTKIQMVYNSRVAGMLSPSYPDGTEDYEAVAEAVKLLNRFGSSNVKTKHVFVLDKDHSKDVHKLRETLEKTYKSQQDTIALSAYVEVSHYEKVEAGHVFRVRISGMTKERFIKLLKKHKHIDAASDLENWKSSNPKYPNSGWDSYMSKTYKAISLELGLPTAKALYGE